MNDIIATVKILNLKPAKQHDVSAYTKMISLFHSLLKIWNNSQPNDVSQFYNSLVYFRVKHNFSPGTEFSPHFSLKWGQPNNKIIFDEITLIMIIITRDSPSRKHAGTKDFTAKPLDPKRFLSSFRVSKSIKNEKNIYIHILKIYSPYQPQSPSGPLSYFQRNSSSPPPIPALAPVPASSIPLALLPCGMRQRPIYLDCRCSPSRCKAFLRLSLFDTDFHIFHWSHTQ